MTRRSTIRSPWRCFQAVTILLIGLTVGQPDRCWAQTANARRVAGEKVTSTAPVRVRLWNAQAKMDVVLVGRTATHLLQAPDAAGNNPRLALADIEGAIFDLDYNRYEVMRAVSRNDWATAIRLQYKACEPTFPYLDLPNNNAAAEAQELGTTMLRAAARSMHDAQNEADRERAKRQFESAYAVFQYCAKVDWSSIGLMAKLKGCRCLLGMDKARAAYFQIVDLDEPLVGDAAYGHYWLVQAELHLVTNGFVGAMEASVKSLCFENKDVETFPDALLISARCYEALNEPYRARDVYFEIAKLFPRTDWASDATGRLRVLMASGVTHEAEAATVERAFLASDEDMNKLVQAYLDEQGKPPVETPEEQESEVVDRLAPAGN